MDQNSHLYPAVYKASIKAIILPLLIYTLLYFLAVVGRVHLNVRSPFSIWLIVIGGYIFIAYSLLSKAFCTVTLFEDRIEIKTWLGRKVMKKSDAGKLKSRGHGLMMLSYKYNSGDGIVIPKGMGGDAAWNVWMAGLIDDRKSKRA